MNHRIQIEERVLDRLEAVSDQIYPLMDHGSLSPSNLISLLLDHWQYGAPPVREWIRNQGNLYPGNGGSEWMRHHRG